MSDSPGSTPTPTSASRPARRPRIRPRELLVAELDAGPLVRRRRDRVRQRHRHVEVVGAGRERPLEDRHDEARIDRVQDVGDRVLAAERGDVVRLRGIDPRGDEALVAGEPGDGPLGAAGVVVGDDHPLEEVAPSRDRDDRAADTTRTDDEDPHPVPPIRATEAQCARPTVAARRCAGRASAAGANFQSIGAGEAVVELGASAVAQVPGPTAARTGRDR